MSGGTYDYIYSRLSEECENRMYDAEMDDLIKDLCEVLHDFVNLIDDIKEIPSAEPETGHWIRMKAYEKWECSDCNTAFRFTFKEHNFCPNCGAKMIER